MDDDKNICYPYAFGRLDGGIQDLTIALEMDCINEGVDIDDKVLKILRERITRLRKISVEESYDKH